MSTSVLTSFKEKLNLWKSTFVVYKILGVKEVGFCNKYKRKKIYSLIFTFYYEGKTRIKNLFGGTREIIGGAGRSSPILMVVDWA